MRSWLKYCIVFFFLWFSLGFVCPKNVSALDFYDYLKISITPIPCNPYAGGTDVASCPTLRLGDNTTTPVTNSVAYQDWMNDFNSYKDTLGSKYTFKEKESCATSYLPKAGSTRPFVEDPKNYHYWAEDQEITALGKSSERARQFVYWAFERGAVDQILSLKQIWSINRNIAFSFMILVTAILGLAIIVANRVRSGYKFSVQGSLTKIGLSVLYIAFSATAIFTLVSLSDILMKFFIESLGGDKLFNTYFGAQSSEANYIGFVGCRDLNIRVQESAQAQIFLIYLTNITHYMLGVALILRKILLWFLLIVSPFLPILLSFPLIRNTGKIWIGVFFQWLFYGPLFALFFSASAKLFQDGIPFIFDFSRVEKVTGYIFPTAIMITYGGPAQLINGINNGNYVDTFAEYVITLIMLWAATWFPWWLLRIFRDDCCDGIYAMRNALYGFIDKTSKPPDHPSSPPPQPTSPSKFELPVPQVVPQDVRQKEQAHIQLENVNMVRQAKTADLASTLNLRASSLRDIARLETNKQASTIAKTNFALLSNPLSATTASDRQKYLNLRTELFTRASTKNDTLAQYMLTATSRSSQSYITRRNEIAKSMESVISRIGEKKDINLTESTAQASHTTTEKVIDVTRSVVNNIVNNQSALQSIATGAHTSLSATKQILQTYTQHISQPIGEVVNTISQVTQTTKEQVREVLHETHNLITRAHSVERITRMVAPSKEHATQVLTQINSFISSIAETTSSIGNQVINKISQMALELLKNEPSIVNQIAHNTQTTSQQIFQILQMATEKGSLAIKDIREKSNLTQEQLQNILIESAQAIESRVPESVRAFTRAGVPITDIIRTTLQSEMQSTTVAKLETNTVSQLQKVFEDKSVSTFTKELLRHSKTDEQLITDIQTTMSLSKKQVEEVLARLVDAPSIADTATLEKIKLDVGVEPIQSMQIVKESVKHAQSARSVVSGPEQLITGTEQKQEKQNVAQTAQILEDQIEAVLNPSSQIDQVIPLPEDAQSLEEYAEIRQLWMDQYEKGEVPLSEEVHTRLEWVEQDAYIITEILSKLISADEPTRQKALDDVGFILPVFLMNNLSGTQLITYLKAKVSAAKEVRLTLKQKMDEDESTLEEVSRQTGPVEENVKHLEVDESGETRTAEEGDIPKEKSLD